MLSKSFIFCAFSSSLYSCLLLLESAFDVDFFLATYSDWVRNYIAFAAWSSPGSYWSPIPFLLSWLPLLAYTECKTMRWHPPRWTCNSSPSIRGWIFLCTSKTVGSKRRLRKAPKGTEFLRDPLCGTFAPWLNRWGSLRRLDFSLSYL